MTKIASQGQAWNHTVYVFRGFICLKESVDKQNTVK